jgi:8-oxo-dGTP diphosphatase
MVPNKRRTGNGSLFDTMDLMNSSERFSLRAAVYLILRRGDSVLLLRRSNTGWHDGEYTLPAGHIDGEESVRTAMVREAKEELGITLTESSLMFEHVMHQQDELEYIDFYFEASTWEGEPTNLEPEKCDDLQWFALSDLPDGLLPNVAQALAAYQRGDNYSEFSWA